MSDKNDPDGCFVLKGMVVIAIVGTVTAALCYRLFIWIAFEIGG